MFDPLGLIEPYTAHLKELYSTIFKDKHQWNDIVDSKLVDKWNDTVNKFLNEIIVKRYTGIPSEFHIFGNASETRYSACIYGKINHEFILLQIQSRTN